jgi:carbamoyl-phosphate synthase large subunit
MQKWEPNVEIEPLDERHPMPRREDLSTILIIGAGPIVIGQACEFDYSGTQAVKALKEEGYRVVLINSNPATIMTDPELADATYIEPITPEMVEKVIIRERHAKPGGFALLPTMGGQTALNTAIALDEQGILAKQDVELIGATRDAIERAEDRDKFRQAMTELGLESPRSTIAETMDEALAALDEIGLPAIIRPAFTLGGTGGGAAYNRDDFDKICRQGLAASPTNQILIDESLVGWKEFEMEVVRDKADNAIIICSIENIDPMGVHTGDSITVAPALTLTDKEYQIMRTAAIACLRKIGVETGGSNVQFGLNPETGRMVVIEMNPRVSRSSALASKATGFPIAKIAAKLAVGYTLDELENDITKATPASFEPTLDYVVVKIPRFAFEKFRGSDDALTTSMKSVGEAMAIGRNFNEALQKAYRSLETGLTGLDDQIVAPEVTGDERIRAITAVLSKQSPMRLLNAAQALREGLSVAQIYAATKFDPWFLERMAEVVSAENGVRAHGLPNDVQSFAFLKRMGFSDARLGQLVGVSESAVRAQRQALGLRPVYKRIDSCAAEFEALTPYLYASYESGFDHDAECEARPSERKKIIILGGGPNRIGQGIEFDYCCCHACFALTNAGYETVMVNCNPETVSTDYDTSDRLYFEPLTVETVLDIIEKEQSAGILHGVIVQFGGQTPLNLANALKKAGVPILGTPPDAIDLAEDRERFQQCINALGLKQPPNATVKTVEEAVVAAEKIGYPVVLRPSFVLGGRGMEIARDRRDLERYIREAVGVSGEKPLLIDGFLNAAVEIDVDALSDGKTVWIAGVIEHIEEAGVHSGDSACALPPHSIGAPTIQKIEEQTIALAKALGVVGLMNVQFALQDGAIFLLEANPRASRTIPFVAKSVGAPIAKIAARVMAGEPLDNFPKPRIPENHVAVKEAVLPFERFPGVDTILGPEMRSTGEVMGLDQGFGRAFLKSQIGAGVKLPEGGSVFVSVRDADKSAVAHLGHRLVALGFEVVATSGTAAFLESQGVPTTRVKKVYEGHPNIVDRMKNGEIDLVFNTTEGAQALRDSFDIRATALQRRMPYYTTAAGARAAVAAMENMRSREIEVAPLQSFFSSS